ncbi:LysR substrate-binding domain-containing protein [Pseudoalteromonas rubra]|uniref:LysR substrate-binding domain-containing protein n=1 Tax=Pseudoalteromonas rubra TaxID=43658 RepID=UPI000F7A3E5C|nr:LysR substrate-binding domain-containing protein [Pseudoalteromonas rubra]
MATPVMPPLKSLYIFSVAARHLNFSRAAEELCITPSAVSHQIRRLEDWLGCKLFEKSGKQLIMTQKAQNYALQIRQSFEHIHNATCEITSYQSGPIQLGISSAFAMKRLMPALEKWQLANPEVDLRVRMLNCEDKPEALELDAVVANQIHHVSYQSKFICHESYHPMCSPSLAGQVSGFPNLDAASDIPLIDIEGVNIWSLWQQDKNISFPDGQTHILFGHTLLLVQAALYGQGIAMLEKALVKNELESGALICLDNDGFIPPQTAYYFSWRKSRRNDPALKKLQSWLEGLLFE